MDFTKVKESEILEELSKRGYTSTKTNFKINEVYKFPKLEKPLKLGIVSCTHLGSKYQQLSLLTHFYKYCKNLGVPTIIHCGDISEGNGRLYKGQLYEMFLHGADSQLDYMTEYYPQIEGIRTAIISGNHDDSYWKDGGYDIVDALAEKRKDISYLGMTGAYLQFGKIKIYVLHKRGGVAYARSYHLQKIIEQMAPGRKPNILFVGGDHVSDHLPMYRNVEGFLIGCFQSQTPYMQTKGIYPAIQGLIVTICPDEKGIYSISTKWKNYYEPVEHDY